MEADAFCNTCNGLSRPLDLVQSFSKDSFSLGEVFIALFIDALSTVNSCLLMIAAYRASPFLPLPLFLVPCAELKVLAYKIPQGEKPYVDTRKSVIPKCVPVFNELPRSFRCQWHVHSTLQLVTVKITLTSHCFNVIFYLYWELQKEKRQLGYKISIVYQMNSHQIISKLGLFKILNSWLLLHINKKGLLKTELFKYPWRHLPCAGR